MNATTPQLSVLMPICAKESKRLLFESLSSLADQTVQADEVVIVKDGQLTDDLELVLESFVRILPMRCIDRKEFSGIGVALQHGVNECRGEWVARMDSDDICVPDRFERQLDYLRCHPQVDVVGGYIAEFSDDPARLEGTRCLPLNGTALSNFARRRNPLNHMTVMFRRRSVLAAGSYLPGVGFEDYYLWARMLNAGFRLANLKDILVYVRAGRAMYKRRGGLKYLRDEIKFQSVLRKIGFLSNFQFASNLLIRAPVRLVPSPVRRIVYRVALRDPLPSRMALERVRIYSLPEHLARPKKVEDASLS